MTFEQQSAEDISIDELIGAPALDALEPDWRRLASTAKPSLFCHDFDWLRLYVRHRPPGPLRKAAEDSVRFLVFRDAAAAVRAIVPLVVSTEHIKRVPFTAWRLLAIERISDILCDDSALESRLVPLVIRHLRGKRSRPALMVWGPVTPGTSAWRAAQGAATATRSTSHNAPGYTIVDTARTFDQFCRSLTAKARGNLRRRRDRLERMGAVFRTAATSDDLDSAFEDLIRVEAASWKGAPGRRTAMRYNPRSRDFHRALALTQGDCHRPEIHSLWVGERCIAARLCIQHGDEMVLLKSGYDEAHANLAPGQMLLGHVIERCCHDESVRRVNFMVDQPWHRFWCASFEPCHDFYFPVRKIRGSIAVRLAQLKLARPRKRKSGSS